MRRIYVAVAATLLAAEAFGQIATTTSLVGTVTDASDKPIAECRIRAMNQGSGDTYSVLTSDKGNYNIQFIHVGNFAISSQLIDNLNASVHLRALLTDVFLLGEVLRAQPVAARSAGS